MEYIDLVRSISEDVSIWSCYNQTTNRADVLPQSELAIWEIFETSSACVDKRSCLPSFIYVLKAELCQRPRLWRTLSLTPALAKAVVSPALNEWVLMTP